VGETHQGEHIQLYLGSEELAVTLDKPTVLGLAARVVYQQVDRPLLGFQAGFDARQIRAICQVRWEDLDIHAAPGTKLIGQARERRRAPSDQYERRPIGSQSAGERFPDARRTARHQRTRPRVAATLGRYLGTSCRCRVAFGHRLQRLRAL